MKKKIWGYFSFESVFQKKLSNRTIGDEGIDDQAISVEFMMKCVVEKNTSFKNRRRYTIFIHGGHQSGICQGWLIIYKISKATRKSDKFWLRMRINAKISCTFAANEN